MYRQNSTFTNKIVEEIDPLEVKNAKIFKARSLRSLAILKYSLYLRLVDRCSCMTVMTYCITLWYTILERLHVIKTTYFIVLPTESVLGAQNTHVF